MKKLVVIGDIHGDPSWKTIVNREKDDRYIFMGDYWDSFYIRFGEQLSNFLDILEFKKNNDVILLLGNHDYLFNECSGYQYGWANHIKELMNEHIDNFQMIHIEGNYLFSHAGVTYEWMDRAGATLDTINNLPFESFNYYHKDEDSSPYGDNTYQSPIWVRLNSLSIDGVKEFTHVVGHTHHNQVREENNYICVDALPHQYLVIENNETTIKKV